MSAAAADKLMPIAAAAKRMRVIIVMRYGSDSIERGIYCLIDAREITQKIPDQLTTPSLESEIREHVQGCMLRFCDSRGRAARVARTHGEPPYGSTASSPALISTSWPQSPTAMRSTSFQPVRI